MPFGNPRDTIKYSRQMRLQWYAQMTLYEKRWKHVVNYQLFQVNSSTGTVNSDDSVHQAAHN